MSVGAVYDRALCLESTKYAVTDRAYSRFGIIRNIFRPSGSALKPKRKYSRHAGFCGSQLSEAEGTP
jgi:hypothetical protein